MNTTTEALVIGIVGTGLMGRGIAQIAAQAGIAVRLFDNRAGAALEAREAIAATLGKLADKGKLDAAALDAALGRLHVADALTGLADCRVVVEAIVEKLDAKRALFRELEDVVGDDCLLATNTSSLSVTAIASACRLPGRVGGFHFFSPVPLMKVVEVIDSELGETWVGDTLTALAQRVGHRPIRTRDTPGFVVNHAGRAYGTEALRILGEGIAEPAAIDRILRAAGFRMGPFELFDMIGLDVSQPVMESIYDQYFQEPRYRPSPITRQRLAAGLLGRKSGRGFYVYEDGKAVVPPLPAAPTAGATPIWVSARNPLLREQVVALLRAGGGVIDAGERPAAGSACIVLPVGGDATTAVLDEKLDPRRSVALDPILIDRQLTLMTTPVTERASRNAVWGALGGAGLPLTVIHDSAGFVAQRVLAMIVNIGCDIAQQRIAAPADIDDAVTLGLGYPKGPLALGDSLGAGTVLRILNGLYDFYQDPRYRPSPWLLRRARLGVSLLTPEA